MNAPATTFRARCAIGIDQTGPGLIMVKAIRRGRIVTFEQLGDAALPSDLPPSTVLVGCLLQKESFTRQLTAPITSAKKAEQVFPALLDVQLPFSVEDCVFTLVETRPSPDRSGTCGLVAGARNVDIEKRLASFSPLGFNPHLLDQEGIALWTRSLEELPPVAGGTDVRIILYLASDRVTLVVGQDGHFLGSHTMRLLDDAQIHRILKSHFTTLPASTQWILAGPEAAHPGSPDTPLAILAKRWQGSIKVIREPSPFLARALAARALTRGELRCNLRTGVFLHPELARRQARLPYQWAVASLLAGLLLCTVNAAWALHVAHQAAESRERFRSLAIEITGSPLGIPKGQEVLAARRAIEAQAKAMEPFLAASDTPIPHMLETALQTFRTEGLAAENLILSRKNMVIHGLAPKWTQAEAATRLLNTQGWRATLERKETPSGDERIAFVISLERTNEK